MATRFPQAPSIGSVPRPDLPTMYDLPSEDPEEPGLADDFHYYQPQLLRETFEPADYPRERIYMATDLNLYFEALEGALSQAGYSRQSLMVRYAGLRAGGLDRRLPGDQRKMAAVV